MNNQNINPQHSKENNESPAPNNGDLTKTGLDEWNERLDENLEPEGEADVQADENAEDFQNDVNTDAKPA
jgi:hypothetical protein